MLRRVPPLGAVLCTALLLSVAPPAASQSVRSPTPRAHIAQSLAPLRAALDALTATESERDAVADLVARAETAAAARVEADHRHDLAAAASATRRVELVIEAVRARITALRAEARAVEAEAAAVAAEQALVLRQGELERASARAILVGRGDAPAAPPAAPSAAPRAAPEPAR
jgi:hypothetical protein